MTTDSVPQGSDGASGEGAGKLPRRVLVIEDNMIIALDTEEMLRELGVEHVANSVTQALEAIAQDQPEFAVLDFNLGEESGEPVARELAQRRIPFVLATGYNAGDVPVAQLGARAILKKPFDKAGLANALRMIS